MGVEHKLLADEQKSDMSHRQAGRLGTFLRSFCDQSWTSADRASLQKLPWWKASMAG
jgi:hypothetical protein